MPAKRKQQPVALELGATPIGAALMGTAKKNKMDPIAGGMPSETELAEEKPGLSVGGGSTSDQLGSLSAAAQPPAPVEEEAADPGSPPGDARDPPSTQPDPTSPAEARLASGAAGIPPGVDDPPITQPDAAAPVGEAAGSPAVPGAVPQDLQEVPPQQTGTGTVGTSDPAKNVLSGAGGVDAEGVPSSLVDFAAGFDQVRSLLRRVSDETPAQPIQGKCDVDKSGEVAPNTASGGAEDALDPIDKAIAKWHEALPGPLMMGLFRKVRSLRGLQVATACSGSDIAIVTLQRLSEHWATAFGCHVPVKQLFACEKQKCLQEFLHEQFPDCEAIFGDTAVLQFNHAEKVGAAPGDPPTRIQTAEIYLAGFVCKARSKLNNRRRDNVNCVQDGVASTGKSFQEVAAYVRAHRPKGVIFENVTDLAEEPADGDGMSDCNWILDWFKKLGYCAIVINTEARAYGSLARRSRLYWLAVLGPDGGRADLMRDMMSSMRIPQVCSIDAYLLEKACLQVRSVVGANVDDSDKDLKYKQDHMALFDERGMSWPPPRSHYKGEFDNLDQRRFEVIYFCDIVFPPVVDPKRPDEVITEYMDCNKSLFRLVGSSGQTRPWTKVFPTMTGSGHYVMRRSERAPCSTSIVPRCVADIEGSTGLELRTEVRMIDGIELMQLAGWPLSAYRGDFPSHNMARSMAGNAFSAFAVGPCLVATVAALDVDAVPAEQSAMLAEGVDQSDDDGEPLSD